MDNFSLYKLRLETSNKIPKDLLIQGKRRTMQGALNSTYNSETILWNGQQIKALITDINTLPRIDRKHLSSLETDIDVGDVIHWVETDSRWLITFKSLSERAIFQGFISEARFNLRWRDLNTGRVYEAWAAARGPEQVSISDGVKGNIVYDEFTDSGYIMLPANTPGIEFLKRYEEIVLNGKRWGIEIVDKTTYKNLVAINLKEVAFDKEKDSEDLANKFYEIDFTFFSALDDLNKVTLGDEIELKPVLKRNGDIVSFDYTVEVENCSYDEETGKVVFDSLDVASVIVNYNDLEENFGYIVEVLEEVAEEVTVSNIIGNAVMRTMTSEVYTMRNLVNGIQVDLTGNWEVNSPLVNHSVNPDGSVTLTARNRTGKVILKYTSEENEYYKEITIIPIFGRS